MPKLVSAAPTFLVDNVESTTNWYADKLGFRASFVPKQPPYVYAGLVRDQVEIILLRLEGYRKPKIERPTGHWDAYIRMQDLRDFYQEARAKVPIRRELKQQPYGDWEFEIEDPNGYILVFSEIQL